MNPWIIAIWTNVVRCFQNVKCIPIAVLWSASLPQEDFSWIWFHEIHIPLIVTVAQNVTLSQLPGMSKVNKVPHEFHMWSIPLFYSFPQTTLPSLLFTYTDRTSVLFDPSMSAFLPVVWELMSFFSRVDVSVHTELTLEYSPVSTWYKLSPAEQQGPKLDIYLIYSYTMAYDSHFQIHWII